MYFECNLPEKVPSYIEEPVAEVLRRIIPQVKARTEKLNRALEITGMDGATFAEYAGGLFKQSPARFDDLGSEDLAMYVSLVCTPGYYAAERLEWPNATVLVDTAFLTRQEWEAVRHLGIGGSDAAVVQGLSPYRTKYGLYHDKKGSPKDDEGKAAIFDRGHFMEGRVIQAVCELTGAVVIPETRMFQSKKYPASIADIDAILRLPDGKIAIFEAKTTVAENYNAWDAGKIPAHYVPQTRQYPAVLNDDRVTATYIGCLFTQDISIGGIYVGSEFDGERFLSRRVERNQKEEMELLAKNQEFYDTALMGGKVPKLTDGPASMTKAELARVVGKADQTSPVADLEDTYLPAVVEYLNAKERQAAFQARADELKELADAKALSLIERLGTTVEGRIAVPGGEDGEYYEVKYAPRKRVNVDFEKLRVAFPDAYAACVAEDPCAFRVFSIRVKKPKPKGKRKSA